MEVKPQARTLEITVMSGENISMDRSSVAENVYVVVRAESLNSCRTKMVNEEGGVHAWNEKFLLDIPLYAKSVTFEVQCKKYKGVRHEQQHTRSPPPNFDPCLCFLPT